MYRELRAFGLECGNGWFNLIWQLSADIESTARLEGLAENTNAWPCVDVVKQKLGDLCVQFTALVSDRISNLVDKAMERSLKESEVCAKPCNKVLLTEQVQLVKPLCDTCHIGSELDCINNKP